MYASIVAVDLETSGADPYRDHIIEIGALLYEDGKVTAQFSELCACPVPLTPGIIKLTGITPEMLKDARPLVDVLEDFLAFLPDDAMVIAHNGTFERSFLRAATKDRFRHTVLDTLELSRICFPFLASHSLGILREALELGVPESHRALPDCEALIALWEKILQQAATIPAPVLAEMNFLLTSNTRHPYRDFFRRLEQQALTEQFGRTETSLETLFPSMPPLQAPPQRHEIDEPYAPLDEELVGSCFEESGAFAQTLPNYEPREGQVQMTRAVAQAFNEQQHLCVEAGTGIGKSFAYLVPAVLWAKENNAPVVISTNTKNLQAQLFDKDIPLVRDVLKTDFSAALIKGRRNYLCLRKLMYVIRQAAQELDSEDRMRMLNLLPWAVWTKTGDISENIVNGRPGFGGLWSKLCTIGDECMGKGCRQQGRCFLRKARAQALAADIVVANHSLIFSELNMKSPALPPYAQIVFDEAHNLEAAATSHLSVEVSSSRFSFALGRLHRPGRKGDGTGLAPSILFQLRDNACSIAKELREQAITHGEAIVDAVQAAQGTIKPFFDALQGVLPKQGASSVVRVYAERKRPSLWEPVQLAKEDLVRGLAGVQRACEALRDNLREVENGDLRYLREFQRDLQAALTWVQEVSFDLEFVLRSDDPGYVYWVESTTGRHGGARMWAAPISVGPLLYDQLYARKHSVIFSSATMTVRHSFDFLKKRLGIDLIPPERLIEMDVGTPFDYPKQCMAAVPLFLPEPSERDRDYTAELSILLAEVFRRSQGRALTLFTSYDMLRKVTQHLQDELLGDGLQVLAQGMSGSRENITAIFKRDIHSVLLGTHSFWEGVDVAGEALSCLAIARLPFSVFTDPIIEARCEQMEADGQDAFWGYTLPSAVIRFRQGFGRLIRHKTDHGIAIIADRRISSRRYGKWFQESLPVPTEIFSNREEFLDAVEDWLDTAQ